MPEVKAVELVFVIVTENEELVHSLILPPGGKLVTDTCSGTDCPYEAIHPKISKSMERQALRKGRVNFEIIILFLSLIIKLNAK